jgi:uncharacterized RDD family membrane protein YckC
MTLPDTAPTYAPFRKRLYAYGYDSFIVTAVALLIGWLLGGSAFAQTPEDIQTLVNAGLLPQGTDAAALTAALGAGGGDGGFGWGDLVLPMLVSAFYNIAFTHSRWQATLGKRFCGMYVTTAQGARLSLAQAALRHVASGLSMLLGGLGYVSIWFTRERTALHDMLCNTRVIMGKAG